MAFVSLKSTRSVGVVYAFNANKGPGTIHCGRVSMETQVQYIEPAPFAIKKYITHDTAPTAPTAKE